MLGVLSWQWGRRPELAPLLLLAAMGILSFQLREPTVTSRIGFSFLSIILLASGAILGPFGAWCVGLVSVGHRPRPQDALVPAGLQHRDDGDHRGRRRVGLRLSRGVRGPRVAVGPADIATELGLPAARRRRRAVPHQRAAALRRHPPLPGGPVPRLPAPGARQLGVAYVGYGAIGFLFVILWFPAELGAVQRRPHPRAAARGAVGVHPVRRRAALARAHGGHPRHRARDQGAGCGGAEPAGRPRWPSGSPRSWGSDRSQIGTVRYAAMLHEIGHLGVPTRLLRRPRSSLSAAERRVIDRHCVLGARMIEGIDFLEPARSGIRHQHERFDGRGAPTASPGRRSPSSRACSPSSGASRTSSAASGDGRRCARGGVVRRSRRDAGRFDPAVLAALRAALDKHGLATAVIGGGDADMNRARAAETVALVPRRSSSSSPASLAASGAGDFPGLGQRGDLGLVVASRRHHRPRASGSRSRRPGSAGPRRSRRPAPSGSASSSRCPEGQLSPTAAAFVIAVTAVATAVGVGVAGSWPGTASASSR